MSNNIRIGTSGNNSIHIGARSDGTVMFDVAGFSISICSDVSESQARQIVGTLVGVFPNIGTVRLSPIESILHSYGVDPDFLTECADKIAAVKES